MTTKEQNLRLLDAAEELLHSIREQVSAGKDDSKALIRFDFQQDPLRNIPRHVRLEVVVDITED